MSFNLKVSGVWKVAVPFLKVSGAWKRATLFTKVSGTWKRITTIYDPPSGSPSAYNGAGGAASVTLTSAVAATWTYSGGGAGTSVNQASGYVGTSITFTANGSASPGTTRIGNWTVSATDGSEIGNWAVNCTSETP